MRVLEHIIGLVAPHNCVGCGAEGSLLCAWCLPDAFTAPPSRCYRCQAQTQDSAVCASCRPQACLKHVWVATEYVGSSKELLRVLKFARARAAADIIAAALFDSIPYLAPQTILVHVPAATSRVRKRGYDQSRLIARLLSRKTGLRHLGLLTRHGQSRQVGARREKRLSQIENAFSVPRKYLVKDAHILLIDDVLTTGATLQAAAKALKTAGAKTVDAAVFAQKL